MTRDSQLESANVAAAAAPEDSAKELQNLLQHVTPLILAFISKGQQSRDPDDDRAWRPGSLTAGLSPPVLAQELNFCLPDQGRGEEGVLEVLRRLFQYSANTWHQGFMDKLYASTNACGVVSEMVLAVLNTNAHVYNVSPALTVIEKTVGRDLARLFGFTGANAGGITQPGGSAANLTALVVARNTLFPDTKANGCAQRRLIVLTSAHGHYSFEKAAQICGLGSNAVWPVNVGEDGRMDVADLERKIEAAQAQGLTPFFCNATAGTTVLGSYDSLPDIAPLCKKHGIWLHCDASWGGPAIFAPSYKWKLNGSEKADSITVNPHKMMNVPLTCSFLLAKDMMTMWRSNTLPAGYLFHEAEPSEGAMPEFWDLADVSLQCGRKSDALKLALSWTYFGSEGFALKIENAFSVAQELHNVLAGRRDFVLECKEPACLQVCFYHRPVAGDPVQTSRRTKLLAHKLSERNFLVDYAPGKLGLMLRAVVSLTTQRSTIHKLVQSIEAIDQECEASQSL